MEAIRLFLRQAIVGEESLRDVRNPALDLDGDMTFLAGAGRVPRTPRWAACVAHDGPSQSEEPRLLHLTIAK